MSFLIIALRWPCQWGAMSLMEAAVAGLGGAGLVADDRLGDQGPDDGRLAAVLLDRLHLEAAVGGRRAGDEGIADQEAVRAAATVLVKRLVMTVILWLGGDPLTDELTLEGRASMGCSGGNGPSRLAL